MDLSTIVEVALCTRAVDVNEKLNEGWVLLSTQGGKDDDGYPIFWYSIGRPEEADGET